MQAKRNSQRPVSQSGSVVEETLRGQRAIWPEIAVRAREAASQLPRTAPGRIVLLGVGSSHFAARLTAQPLARALAACNPRLASAEVLACGSTSVGHEIFGRPTDWVFAFTHRGGTPATLAAVEHFYRAGAFTAIVTGDQAPRPEHAELHLPTSPMERCEPHTVSVTGAICAVTTLLLGERAREEWFALSREADPSLDELRKRTAAGPTIVLGEWEGEWLARETALKLMEMARLPIRAFGTEEYFHGPRMARLPDDRFWYVRTQDDPRARDVAELLKPGITVTAGGEATVGSSLGWVRALVELQWLSLAVALNLGVQPDGLEK